jgi:hypothetical protein
MLGAELDQDSHQHGNRPDPRRSLPPSLLCKEIKEACKVRPTSVPPSLPSWLYAYLIFGGRDQNNWIISTAQFTWVASIFSTILGFILGFGMMVHTMTTVCHIWIGDLMGLVFFVRREVMWCVQTQHESSLFFVAFHDFPKIGVYTPSLHFPIQKDTFWINLGSTTLGTSTTYIDLLNIYCPDFRLQQQVSGTHQPSSLWDSHFKSNSHLVPMYYQVFLLCKHTLPHVILQKWYLFVVSSFMVVSWWFIAQIPRVRRRSAHHLATEPSSRLQGFGISFWWFVETWIYMKLLLYDYIYIYIIIIYNYI